MRPTEQLNCDAVATAYPTEVVWSWEGLLEMFPTFIPN